ncbi:MAG: nucleoside recognition domain-containing protein [Methylosarcina sp.]
MLNIIWICFFLIAFVTALVKLLVFGDSRVFSDIMTALFSQSKSAFEIALGLTGILSLWLGIMRIGERSGFIRLLTRGLTPLFSRLTPDIPKDHPALGAMVMNLSANVLGLDNAATPLGIKAMKELQTLNPNPETASNAQILFLVINTSSVTLFPVTIFTYRAQLGAVNKRFIGIYSFLKSPEDKSHDQGKKSHIADQSRLLEHLLARQAGEIAENAADQHRESTQICQYHPVRQIDLLHCGDSQQAGQR